MRLDETTSLATLNPLSESWQEAIIADLEGYMRTISTEVVMIICERLKKIGEMNPSSAKQISVLAKDYGVDMERIKKAIAKQLSLSASEVDDIFDRAAKDSCDLADALAMHRLNVVDRRMVELTARAAAKRFKEGLLNLPDTFAFKMGNQMLPLRQAYIQATNKATLAAYSGALDYNTAIRGIVKQLSNQGIQTVEWESGYHRRLDSSVRMNVLEGVRQLNQGVLDEAGEKFATGYEISAHDRPAPDHEDIQGKQYTLQEYEKLNASLERPIGTLNCMHIAYPIIYGVTPPTYTEAQLQQMKDNAHEKYEWQGKELNGYECTQKQRWYETEIRKSQDRERALRAAGDTVGADEAKHETAALRKEYKAFSEKVGLKEKLNRTGNSNNIGKNFKDKVKNLPKLSQKSDIVNTKILQVDTDDVGTVSNPMNKAQYHKMKEAIQRKGYSVVAAEGDTKRYLLHIGAEATTDGKGIIHYGEIPSASAFFEECIHLAQIWKYGDLPDSAPKELIAREIWAQHILLRNGSIYGFTDEDFSDIRRNLKRWEDDYKTITGSDFYSTGIERGPGSYWTWENLIDEHR